MSDAEDPTDAAAVEEDPAAAALSLCISAITAAFAGNTQADSIASALCDQFATISSSVAEVADSVGGVSETVGHVSYGLNTLLLLFGGALVFIMHGGFAMLCAGSIRSKNAMNILLQTILDAAVSGVMFYCVGFGFAFGQGNKPNKFIGDALFGLSRYISHQTPSGAVGTLDADGNRWEVQPVGRWIDFFFQWAFAATATTIPAGAVAERFNFNAYLGYSIFISGFVYPVVAHWAWCYTGWANYGAILSPVFNAGYIDFAGSGVIHMVGGLAGLVGAVMVGPRLGRFDADGNPVDMPGHSAILVVLGTVLLWFGWYGFNPTSVLYLDYSQGAGRSTFATVCGRAAVTTTLAACAGGLACLLNGFRKHRGWDLVGLCNGVLCGLVAITASAHVVEPWAALVCGFVAGLFFDFLCWLLLKLKIDDPLSASPMHFGAGMWGVFFVGLLAKQEYIMEYYWHAPSEDGRLTGKNYYPYGAFYKHSNGKLLASQVVVILAIIAWTVCLMAPFFFIFKLFGALRIPPEVEEMGLDRSKHGGSAYNGTGAAGVAASPGNDVMRNHSPPSSKVVPMSA
ncbi:Ammonium transporter 1 member 2 [Tetrabaena socialis]|uniref:Ammonium transporter n=1 Tax=Tetrabaena socialis TaxID=47790 RepID=A0A2J7ZRV8_9CHLO|nr:Ammonium transporter 1 member 2 [Tetrabaena socialis]|eukprot:PNH03009.1 Ammonium transporter 1 member 2 [Tetrabaena socialis]